MAIDPAVRRIVDNFRTIEAAAIKGIEKLREKNTWSRRQKIETIEDAVHRLALLIMQRYRLAGLDIGACTEKLDPAQVANKEDRNLESLGTMVDCEISALRTWTSHGDSTYGDPDVDHEAYLPQISILKST